MHLHAYARNMMSAYRLIRAMAIAYNGYCLCIYALYYLIWCFSTYIATITACA